MLFGMLSVTREARADEFTCPENFGFFAHPESCTSFYFCMMGNAVPLECPEGMAFDGPGHLCVQDDGTMCMPPGEEPPGEEPPGEEPPGEEPPGEEPPVDLPGDAGGAFSCPEQNGVYANPADCATFYTCAGGTADLRGCPAGLHWNAALTQCDTPDAAQCTPVGAPSP
ncbi:Hypothetical protein CAP_0232 [Chondromyces apiculatus DSM 436]|uniref:Chitin-binding type-2 domain-containing protein n=2 Tax=Chondromyces apiculatus TaxID=51 RepID=A0A017TE05_9BACT|nr:Hypothetical protein CAP_0232 [Chondromyces apiculatus DSM 436]